MCGIAGVFHWADGEAVDPAALHAMVRTMVHRGPDDEGFCHHGSFAFGMRRLSIIDLAGGHQPIANEDHSACVILNGEIYNYRALRVELAALGHAFQTHSDTEVLVHAYEEWGEEFLDRLNGMFGLAIWDDRRRRLLLARDRMGIKPLYYTQTPRGLAFASEIKALLELPEVAPVIDPQGLWDYLTYRYVPAPRTLFQGIQKLLPGHSLVAERGAVRVRPFWKLPVFPSASKRPLRLEECHERFESLFCEAVRARTIADVPLGVLLSGGLDSSTVAAVLAREATGPLKTFSVAFEEGGHYDERSYARLVARHLGTDHNEVVIGRKEFTDFLPTYVHLLEEPVADLASIPLYFVCRLARAQVKVVLSGEGSDEVLAGYDFDRVVAHERKVRAFQALPASLRSRVLPWLASLIPNGSGLAGRLAKADAPIGSYGQTWPVHMTRHFTEEAKRALVAIDASALTDSAEWLRGMYRRAEGAEPLDQVLYVHCQGWLPDNLLAKADKMSMANSLELRVPFLDHRLVEFLAESPTSLKVARRGLGRGLWGKAALRWFAGKLLPAEIITRPKRGFPVPAYDWIGGEMRGFARDVLLSRECREAGVFRPAAVETLLQDENLGDRATQHRIWLLLVFELWRGAYGAAFSGQGR